MLPYDCYCNVRDGPNQIQSCNEMIGASNINRAMDQDDDGQKPAEPSRSRKEAERRRRQRINSHLSTLRSLLPNPTKKTDKASLLAGVVHHVRQLRLQLAAVSRQHTEPSSSCSCSSSSRLASADPEHWPFPGDSDGATLISCHGSGLVKVTLCCDDRPGLNSDLAQTFRAFHAKEIRAEMAYSGGRAKLEVLVEWVGRQDEDRVSGLKRALEAVVENRARRSSYRNKRARTSYELR